MYRAASKAQAQKLICMQAHELASRHRDDVSNVVLYTAAVNGSSHTCDQKGETVCCHSNAHLEVSDRQGGITVPHVARVSTDQLHQLHQILPAGGPPSPLTDHSFLRFRESYRFSFCGLYV